MKEPKLAIHGGPKIRTKPFVCQEPIGPEEKEAVNRVMGHGRLSHYRGNYTPSFYGGPEVLALEEAWAKEMGTAFAIAVNSCTSALQVVCGAIGLAPGDEVIVTPWSMSCSATAPLIWNAVPVFADIEEDYYCLDPHSITRVISPLTKAIIVVDLFGQPYDADVINELAHEIGAIVIEDAAQAIGSYYKDKPAGTLGDIGVFSLTYGKHLTSGEGGMIVTDNAMIAQRCRLIRNHAEAVINDMVPKDLNLFNGHNNMVGFNMRMTEIEAAIAHCQLDKLYNIVEAHQRNANFLHGQIGKIPAVKASPVRPDCSHSYYVQAFKWDANKFKELGEEKIHRDTFIRAVKAELTGEKGREVEGVPIGCGYIKPLYLFPLFQNVKLYGGTNYPFTHESLYHYHNHPCPVAERLWSEELFVHRLVGPKMTKKDLDDIYAAFDKVWNSRETLKWSKYALSKYTL